MATRRVGSDPGPGDSEHAVGEGRSDVRDLFEKRKPDQRNCQMSARWTGADLETGWNIYRALETAIFDFVDGITRKCCVRVVVKERGSSSLARDDEAAFWDDGDTNLLLPDARYLEYCCDDRRVWCITNLHPEREKQEGKSQRHTQEQIVIRRTSDAWGPRF